MQKSRRQNLISMTTFWGPKWNYWSKSPKWVDYLKKFNLVCLRDWLNNIYGTDIIFLIPKQTEKRNTEIKFNFIKGKMEEQRLWCLQSYTRFGYKFLFTNYCVSHKIIIPARECSCKTFLSWSLPWTPDKYLDRMRWNNENNNNIHAKR